MIQQDGYLTITRKNCKGLQDADFIQAKREGCLQQLLGSLDTDLVHGPQHNLITGALAGYLFYRLFTSPTPTSYIDQGDWSNDAAMHGMAFLTTDDEPTVSEWWNGWTQWYSLPSVVTTDTGCFKRFEEDQAETDEIKSDPGGRESIYYRERWLHLPSEMITSNIRTFSWYSHNDADRAWDGYGPMTRICRIRLKDSNGLPVIYTKTSAQILLTEYKFILASV